MEAGVRKKAQVGRSNNPRCSAFENPQTDHTERNFSKYVLFMLRDSNLVVNSVSDSDAQRSIQSESQCGARPSWQQTEDSGASSQFSEKNIFFMFNLQFNFL